MFEKNNYNNIKTNSKLKEPIKVKSYPRNLKNENLLS